MQPMHTGEPVARSRDALARPGCNNMPLSEHDTQELRRLLYLKAEGIERQERLQYLRQTWKSSIRSEEDDDSYTLSDPEIPLVYSLHYGQQCSPEWDDGSVPAETADRQKKKEHGKSNLHAEEDFLQKLESLNLDPRLKKLLITYEEVLGALPPPLSCKKLVQMDLKLKPGFEKTRVRRRPYPAPQEQVFWTVHPRVTPGVLGGSVCGGLQTLSQSAEWIGRLSRLSPSMCVYGTAH